MRLALAQIRSTADPQANLEVVERHTRRAADKGAQLVVFPEATMCCFGAPLRDVAEPVDGPWASSVRRVAEQAGVTVVVGMFTPGVDGRVANTMLVTGPSAEAQYDKIHLFDAFGFAESDTVTPGAEPVVVDVDGLRIGLATCYDIRFPGLFIRLADDGARLICVPASWASGPGKVAQWKLLARARALDSTCFVAACGQAGSKTTGMPAGAAPTGVGHSCVVSPLGTVMASLDAAPGLLVADIDPGDVDAARRELPVLANRRLQLGRSPGSVRA